MSVSARVMVAAIGALLVCSGVASAGDECAFTSSAAAMDYAALKAEIDALRSVKQKDSTQLNQRLVELLQSVPDEVDNTLKISQEALRVTIHLANPPPTRLRLSFDAETSGRHVEVEWDPTVTSELGRTVTLKMGTWHVVASAEPSTYTQSAGSVVIHTRFGAFQTTNASQTSWFEGTYVALAAALSAQEVPQQLIMSAWPRPRLTFQCLGLPRMEDTHFAPAPAAASASGLRGFGVAPTAVTDTLSILAEIAVERAKAGALKLLQKRLIDPFCTEPTKVSLGKLGLGHGDELALPRTCELLTSLRLDDILSSGRPLLIALRDDLRHSVAPAAVDQLAGADVFSHLILASALELVNVAIDRGGVEPLDSQLALELLGDVQRLGVRLAPEVLSAMDHVLAGALTADNVAQFKAKLSLQCEADCPAQVRAALKDLLQTPLRAIDPIYNDNTIRPVAVSVLRKAIAADERAQKLVGYACQARLAVTTIKRCQHDGCSAEEVVGMVSKPQTYFATDDQLPLALCWADSNVYQAPPAGAAALQQLVIDGIHLVAPVVDGKGRDRAKAVVHLIVELLRRREGLARADANTQTFAEIANALIDEDYATALNGVMHLAERLRPGSVPAPANKVVQLLGAVTSYAAVYKDTKDADPKAAREIRKQALESLIDAATDRTQRKDETILSIGSNVGLSATWTNAFNVHDDNRFTPAVRVPLGLAIDGPDWGIALRGAVQLVDLGQFVHRGSDNQSGDVSWADFVSPGLEVGFSVPWLDRALNLSFHVAYAPAIPASPVRDGVWRYGISLGYYVPFFDFN